MQKLHGDRIRLREQKIRLRGERNGQSCARRRRKTIRFENADADALHLTFGKNCRVAGKAPTIIRRRNEDAVILRGISAAFRRACS